MGDNGLLYGHLNNLATFNMNPMPIARMYVYRCIYTVTCLYICIYVGNISWCHHNNQFNSINVFINECPTICPYSPTKDVLKSISISMYYYCYIILLYYCILTYYVTSYVYFN